MKYPFLHGGGETGRLIGEYDWAATGLGPIDHWPPVLRTTVALILQSPVPMVVLWGARGVMLYNDAYSVFAGDRHPSLLGSNVREGWGEIASFNDNVLKVVLHGNEQLSYKDMELTLDRDGSMKVLWLDLDYSPILSELGEPLGVLAVVVETTDRVLAQRRIAAERFRLAQLFEQAPSFMALLHGPDHVFELANPAYRTLVGHRELLGKPVGEALTEAAEQGYVRLLDQVYASGESHSARGATFAVRLAPDGSSDERKVDFVFQPIKDDDGRVTGIFVEGVDVTERIRAEDRREALVALTDAIRDASSAEELAFAAARTLGEALAASRVGYARFDPDHEVLHVGRDWCSTGVESVAGVLPIRQFGSFVDTLVQGEPVCIADVHRDPRTSGHTGTLEAHSVRALVNVPLVEHGRLVAILFVNQVSVREWDAHDVALVREFAERTRTAEQRLRGEAEVREARELLELRVQERTRELMDAEAALRQSQKMEAVGQLTGGLAHDFNNLLTSISGSLELMQMRLAQGQVQASDLERYLGTAQTAATRAAALTHRLLAFSRRQTLAPKPTNVVQLVSGIEEMIRRTVGPAVRIEVANTPGVWRCLIDPAQLESAVLNLCINSRDAMPDGGTVTIDTANQVFGPADAHERGLEAGEYVAVCVADTGTGMSPDVMAKAFDPFFTTKPIGMGTGLGLSMIYGFARQSGGAVVIESRLGRGTRMCVYLPRYAGHAAPEAVAEQAPEAERGHASETVLVVDDEPDIRALVSEVLAGLGYSVMQAEDGQAAMQVLDTGAAIDLLVTDVGLPGGMNGRQVADAARVARPGLKVLFVTGYAENAVLGDGQLEPGMHVMTKPFGMEALARRVRQLING